LDGPPISAYPDLQLDVGMALAAMGQHAAALTFLSALLVSVGLSQRQCTLVIIIDGRGTYPGCAGQHAAALPFISYLLLNAGLSQ
jgi:hypothetical protein